MSEPMSAERLAMIRKRAVRAACGKHKDDGWLFCRIDAPDLLAEVERLTDENTRLRAELEAAKGDIRDMLRADHSDEFCEKCKSHKVNTFCMLGNCDNAAWRGAAEIGGAGWVDAAGE